MVGVSPSHDGSPAIHAAADFAKIAEINEDPERRARLEVFS